MAKRRPERSHHGLTTLERIAVLETERPYVLETIDGLKNDLHAVREQMALQTRYFRAGLVLATAGLVQLTGGRFAEIFVETFRLVFKLLAA